MVKEDIDRLLEAGFIYPVVNSEWISPIVVVPKKVGADGKVKIRVCQDFRKLNASTKKDYFPILFTDIILDHVSGHECYSFLDRFSGYNQVFIRPEDQLKTTFTTEWGKCILGMESGVLLGHVVSRNGLEMDLDKVKVILALTAPTNVREIRGFLGYVGYYRRFIKDYARKALPLMELLKKEEEFGWNPERQSAFEELKLILSQAPILSPSDWAKEFHVTLDASGWCLGAILWQFDDSNRESPVYYASRQMSPAEKKYTTTEREALAVIYACKKFRHYLLGYRIIFHTDHDSLKYLVKKSDLSGRIARWILLL